MDNGFTRAESRMLRETVARQGGHDFLLALVDELRDIADCRANSDTCRNEECHAASAVERGMEEITWPKRVARRIEKQHKRA